MYTDVWNDEYFNWLIGIVEPVDPDGSYYMLLRRLFDTVYFYEFEMDANRAHDGLGLRGRFATETGIMLDTDLPCTVLEMMVALAVRIEQDIMYIPNKGDRTYIWFWVMIDNLGLLRMTDDNYDDVVVQAIIFNFMNHMYEVDGEGGLFYVPGRTDMRDVEVWYQMQQYLNEIVYEGDYV